MSSRVASKAKLVVLEMAESTWSWKTPCMRTCHSGVMSWAVRKVSWTSRGTSSKWMWPSSAMRFMRSSECQPSALARATKSSLTSGIMTPAWLRMKATAKSGSMPPLHPAMIEMVPVGATVVRLQLRRRRWSRMRLPPASRAQVSSGPQIDSSHAGKTPRDSASFSDATLVSSSMKAMTVRPSATPSSES